MSLVKFVENGRTRDRYSSTMLEITSLNCMKTFDKGSCLTRQLFWHKSMFRALLSRVTMTMFCFLMRLGGSSPFVTILDAGSWVDFWGGSYLWSQQLETRQNWRSFITIGEFGRMAFSHWYEPSARWDLLGNKFNYDSENRKYNKRKDEKWDNYGKWSSGQGWSFDVFPLHFVCLLQEDKMMIIWARVRRSEGGKYDKIC